MTEQMKQALEKAVVEDTGKKKDYPISTQDACMHGASLFVKLLWHDASQKPSGSGKVLYRGEIGVNLTIYPPHFDWNDSVKRNIIQKWAYVEDLLPETK